jgi:replicative DNA helicase
LITETFLNSCYSVVINKTIKIKKNKALYRDILSVLNFHESKEQLEIPMGVKTKFDCLKKICQMKLDDKSTQNAIDSLMYSKKFQGLQDFLEFKRTEIINDTGAVDIVKQIRLKKTYNSLFDNYDNLSTFVNQFRDGSFDSLDDLALDYQNIIQQMYLNMMNEKRGVSIESSASLDLASDDYTHVLDLIVKKYERKNTTPTGYPILDNEVLNGGGEPSRIYIVAGAPGSGKSTFLNNIIVNAATQSVDLFEEQRDPVEPKVEGIENVYIYITLENTIEESLLRTYQPLFKKDKNDVLRDISNGVDIKKKINDKLKACKSTIIMKYFPAMSVSSLDLMAVLDDAIAEYGKGTIKGLYVDYLDLMKCDTKYDMYRLELGHITLSMKTLAVEYNIPVWLPTQLGRGAYRVQNSNELSLDQITESVKKVEHADFVLLMTRDPVNDNRVYGKVGKNRSGVSNVSLEFDVNFAHFRFNSVRKVSNTAAPDAISNQQQANNFVPIPISNKPLLTKPSDSIPKSFGGMGEIF